DLPDAFDEVAPDPEPVDAFEPLVLPWRTRARLPDHDLTVEAVLDPTRERTSWSGGAPGPLRIVLGGAEVVIDPEVTDGAPLLRVGRDVLAGRILVESCPSRRLSPRHDPAPDRDPTRRPPAPRRRAGPRQHPR